MISSLIAVLSVHFQLGAGLTKQYVDPPCPQILVVCGKTLLLLQVVSVLQDGFVKDQHAVADTLQV